MKQNQLPKNPEEPTPETAQRTTTLHFYQTTIIYLWGSKCGIIALGENTTFDYLSTSLENMWSFWLLLLIDFVLIMGMLIWWVTLLISQAFPPCRFCSFFVVLPFIVLDSILVYDLVQLELFE